MERKGKERKGRRKLEWNTMGLVLEAFCLFQYHDQFDAFYFLLVEEMLMWVPQQRDESGSHERDAKRRFKGRRHTRCR